MKTATEILYEHGIEMSDNDTYNSQLLAAMERYAESYVKHLKGCNCKSPYHYVGKLLQCDKCGRVFKS